MRRNSIDICIADLMSTDEADGRVADGRVVDGGLGKVRGTLGTHAMLERVTMGGCVAEQSCGSDPGFLCNR